ncbi:MAG: response regulator [Candidatus Hermodarchaeota archaeon]
MESSKINIFIVDDDKEMLRLYSESFKLSGLNVIGKAENGIEALEKLINSINKPDVIIMDYHMPKINGIEVSKMILSIYPSLKIIMISGDPSKREQALLNGISDFYEKPYSLNMLCQKIKEITSK